MAEPLVPDDLWEAVAPLLPRHQARPGKRGRPPVDDRACLTGIVFVLRSGIPWEMLPQGDGLRLRRHLLAAVAVLAAPGRLEETPAQPPTAGRAGEGHRLGALLRSQPELPRCFWGVLTRLSSLCCLSMLKFMPESVPSRRVFQVGMQ